RTRTVWSPSARLFSVSGEVQVANAEPSTAHSNVAPLSELKPTAGDGSLVGSVGTVPSVVFGATVSTVNEAVASVPLPAGSLACSLKLCWPSASPDVVNIPEQGRGAAASSAQVKLAVASVEENANVGPVTFVNAGGCWSMLTGGGVRSMVNVAT